MTIQTIAMVGLKNSSRTVGMVTSLKHRLSAGVHKYFKNVGTSKF